MADAGRRETPGDGHAKVATIAEEVGYDSEAAFSRAFKRLMGVSPAAWRRARVGGLARERVTGLS